jgi:hypothetical protein
MRFRKQMYKPELERILLEWRRARLATDQTVTTRDLVTFLYNHVGPVIPGPSSSDKEIVGLEITHNDVRDMWDNHVLYSSRVDLDDDTIIDGTINTMVDDLPSDIDQCVRDIIDNQIDNYMDNYDMSAGDQDD